MEFMNTFFGIVNSDDPSGHQHFFIASSGHSPQGDEFRHLQDEILTAGF
jgi:hypothetical protein